MQPHALRARSPDTLASAMRKAPGKAERRDPNTPSVLRPRIRGRHLDCGIQVEDAKFAGGVPPATALP